MSNKINKKEQEHLQFPNMLSLPSIPYCNSEPGVIFFSIIVTCYNQAWCIRRALHSILNQDFQEYECIVVDDGSSDGSQKILEEYSRYNRKVQVLEHAKNKSVHMARYTGLMHAKGSYVLFLDGDDFFVENSLGLLAAELQNTPAKVLQFSYKIQYINGTIATVHPESTDQDWFMQIARRQNTIWNKVYEGALIKKAFTMIGDMYINYAEDVLETLAVALCCNQLTQAKLCVIHYVFGTGICTRQKSISDLKEDFEITIRLLDKIKNLLQDYAPTKLWLLEDIVGNTLQAALETIEKQVAAEDRLSVFMLLCTYFPFQVLHHHKNYIALRAVNILGVQASKENLYSIVKQSIPRKYWGIAIALRDSALWMINLPKKFIIKIRRKRI